MQTKTNENQTVAPSRSFDRNMLWTIATITCTVLMLGIAIGWMANGNQQAKPSSSDFEAINPLKLYADSAAGGKTVSLATGQIDSGNEALFILDHLTGNLQCWILNQRTNSVGGIFRTNVLGALGGGKRGGDFDFTMTTGFFDFANAGQGVPAQCICYVAEGNSGAAAGFGLTYEKAALQRGAVTTGVLEVVCKGPFRDIKLRDQ